MVFVIWVCGWREPGETRALGLWVEGDAFKRGVTVEAGKTLGMESRIARGYNATGDTISTGVAGCCWDTGTGVRRHPAVVRMGCPRRFLGMVEVVSTWLLVERP